MNKSEVIKEISSAMVAMNPAFQWLEESLVDKTQFYATDVPKDVIHRFHIFSPADEIKKDGKNFIPISLSVHIIFYDIEKLIVDALGESPSHLHTYTLGLSRGFPKEELYLNQMYLIDISSNVAKKLSINCFVRGYEKLLEPIRQKMRTPDCLGDDQFFPFHEGDPLGWVMCRIAWHYLNNSKEEFEAYAERLKEPLALHEMEIEEKAQEEGEHIFIQISRKTAARTKRLLAALKG